MTLTGVAAYAAPELISGEEASTAVDVYALGVVMWEFYMEQRPWSQQRTVNNIFSLVMSGTQLPFPPRPGDGGFGGDGGDGAAGAVGAVGAVGGVEQGGKEANEKGGRTGAAKEEEEGRKSEEGKGKNTEEGDNGGVANVNLDLAFRRLASRCMQLDPSKRPALDHLAKTLLAI